MRPDRLSLFYWSVKAITATLARRGLRIFIERTRRWVVRTNAKGLPAWVSYQRLSPLELTSAGLPLVDGFRLQL